MYDINLNTGELVDCFPQPYPTFRKELEILTSNDPARILRESPLPNYSGDEELKPIFVSRMPNHKVTGAAHKDTIRSPRTIGGVDYSVQKVALTSLKLDKKTGEILNYYNPQDDVLLYSALKRRLEAFDGNAKEAFAEPFYKPRSDGSKGPLVKKVKTIERSTSSVALDGGNAIADNGNMVRVDVFYVSGEGYYLVPIYEADTVKKALPNRAIVANKPMSEWKVMNEDDFVFSLYPNDLIRIVFPGSKNFKIKDTLNKAGSTLPKAKAIKEGFLYYKGTNIHTGSITVIDHDNTYYSEPGTKRLISIEKYSIDVLGNITKIGKEKRVGFRNGI